jgi:antitoxin VapB
MPEYWDFLERPSMPLYIKDDATAQLVTRLAKLRGVSKQDAVKLAVQAELDRAAEAIPLRDRFAALRIAHALPGRTGKATDKAFFDGLSGGL